MNEKILVIQDENIAKISIKPKIEQLGYKAIVISLKEINTIVNSKIEPNLILMHVTPSEKMSRINASILHDFDIPIIHLVDCSNKVMETTCLTNDFSYITEPWEDNKLKNAIKTAIYKHSKKLKDNEEKYRLIFENSGIATVIIDENTTIHKVNTAFENLSGYLQEELEGKKKFEEFISTRQFKEIEMYHNLMRADPKSSPINYKFKFIDRYHEVKEVYSTVSMIQGTKRSIISLLDVSNENTKGVLKREKECTPSENSHSLSFNNPNMTSLNSHMVEMSGLSKSEILSALLENEEYQKTILSTVQTGIVVIDAETKRIIDINESALKFIGTRRDKVIGNICHKFICPADEGHCPIIDHNYVMDNSERILLNINNEEIPIIKTVTPITLKGRKCLIESFMDITKLRLTENALRKSEAVFRSFFNSNDVIMSVIELVDDDIIYVLPNRHVAEFFGENIKDITGKHLSDLDVPANFQSFLIKKIKECLKKGTINIEFNFPDKNHERWYHGSISQIKEKSSKKFSFVAIEITETKLMEDKLKASLNEKELLLHEVHHRVKNNLQIISSLLSLQSKYIEDDETLKIFKESQNRVMSLAMIHEKLYKSSNFVQIDFAEYIKDLVDNLFYTYKIDRNTVHLNINIKNIFFDIETAIPCGLIINELVTNSLKHAFPVASSHGPANHRFADPATYGCGPTDKKSADPANEIRGFEDENREKCSFLDLQNSKFCGSRNEAIENSVFDASKLKNSTVSFNPKIKSGETESLQIEDLQHAKTPIFRDYKTQLRKHQKSDILKDLDVSSIPVASGQGPANKKSASPETESNRFKDLKCTNSAENTVKPHESFNRACMENEVNIELTEVGDEFILSINDNGIGFPLDLDFANTTSLGLQLVNSLVQQLDGTVTVDKTRGTNFKIIFKKMKYKKRL